MKVEAWVLGAVAVFFAVVTPIYWFLSADPTGTSALVMTTLLGALVAFYLYVVAQQIDARPEDRGRAEVADGAGELGFFPPYSWWPLHTSLALVVMVLGVVFGWWLFIIGAGLGAIALVGFVYEYYRGFHAH
ncbi:cytochrome c oxidase subunit 4 [soil metagenome]